MIYQIFKSDSEGSTTLVRKGSSVACDSVLLKEFEAKNLLAACEFYNEYLGFEPFKPMRDKDGNIDPAYLEE